MLKILIPVDGSATALLAVRHGLRLVDEGLRASFVLANVQPPTTLYEMVTAPDPEVLIPATGAAGEHLLESAAALMDAAGVEYEREVMAGEAAHVLIDIVERHACDAVIVGAERGGAWRHALLGSVSQVLTSESPVPVTVVHPAPEVEADAPQSEP